MIDGHIHIEHQPYTLELIDKMVEVALEKGIDELYILDHTHKFKEFDKMYLECVTEELTWQNYQKKRLDQISIGEYVEFVNEVRKRSYPVKLHFGLEVCYFHGQIDFLKSVLDSLLPFKFDFLIGSVHHVDGAMVDYKEEVVRKFDADVYYRHYYELVDEMIKTRMFTFIGHPDLIKIFNIFPSFDLTPIYHKIADSLQVYGQETENNSGLIRRGYPYPGLSPELIKIFKEHHVKFHKSSDAHVYTDIGRVFDELEENYE